MASTQKIHRLLFFEEVSPGYPSTIMVAAATPSLKHVGIVLPSSNFMTSTSSTRRSGTVRNQSIYGQEEGGAGNGAGKAYCLMLMSWYMECDATSQATAYTPREHFSATATEQGGRARETKRECRVSCVVCARARVCVCVVSLTYRYASLNGFPVATTEHLPYSMSPNAGPYPSAGAVAV